MFDYTAGCKILLAKSRGVSYLSVNIEFHRDGILREALNRFQEHHWNISSQLQSMVQLEKPKSMPHRPAILLMLTLNLIGMTIVILNKLRCDKERVTLLARPDGSLHVLAKWTQIVTHNPDEITPIAASPIEDLSWWTIFGVGLGSTALHIALFAIIL
jgi:hypothetical protein